MSDEELKGLTVATANMLRSDLATNGEANAVLCASFEGTPLYRLRAVEEMLREKAGPRWLNDRDAKLKAWGMLRIATEVIPPLAVIIATPGILWDRDDNGELRRTNIECLQALGQTPEKYCLWKQVRGEEPEIWLEDQDQLEGDIKMWGSRSANQEVVLEDWLRAMNV